MVPKTNRRLKDLVCVGPATIKDLHLLGITTIEQLAQQDAQDLYTQLCMHTNIQMNICCLDVFKCAIEQARDPELPQEKRNWFYWSKARKGEL